jgi:hypothetical protein
LAVTVVLLLIVTLQVSALALVHPLHEENGFPLAVVGAIRFSTVPEPYVSVKGVVPVWARLVLPTVYEIVTPLEGLVELTVRT